MLGEVKEEVSVKLGGVMEGGNGCSGVGDGGVRGGGGGGWCLER